MACVPLSVISCVPANRRDPSIDVGVINYVSILKHIQDFSCYFHNRRMRLKTHIYDRLLQVQNVFSTNYNAAIKALALMKTNSP